MAVPGPSSRFLYYFDGGNNLGVNLTGTAGQVGEFNPPAMEEVMQNIEGSTDSYPVVRPVGHTKTADIVIPIWADSTLQELIDDIHGVTGADRVDQRLLVTGWMGGNVIGQRCEMARAWLSKVEPKTPPAQLTLLNTTWRVQGIAEPGYIYHALTARTADGDTKASSIDGTAASALGGAGYFGYTAYTADGATGLAPRVIDSVDNVTFGALITFTTVTATTGGGERSALSSTATVKRYVATDWDFTGTPGAGTTATFFIGFIRN